MKKALTASVLLNLVLLACLFALLKQPASDAPKTESPAEPEVASNEISVSISKDAEEPAVSQSSPSTKIPTHNQLLERPVALPLVFQEVDLTRLNLNPAQLQAIDDLRQRFLDEIGGAEQNPNDPAYRERWLDSQPQIDNDLRGMIGVTAFQNYQIEAADFAESRKSTN